MLVVLEIQIRGRLGTKSLGAADLGKLAVVFWCTQYGNQYKAYTTLQSVSGATVTDSVTSEAFLGAFGTV
jgi:hypothetical protein